VIYTLKYTSAALPIAYDEASIKAISPAVVTEPAELATGVQPGFFAVENVLVVPIETVEPYSVVNTVVEL